MMVRGDDIIEQQITNTILDAPGVALEVAGLYFFGPVGGTVGSWVGNAVSEVLQQPTYQQSIEAFSEWAVDNTLLQTPTGRDFLQKVGEGKVTAILLSQAVYNTKQELRQLGVPPDVISLVLSGLDAE
jgi:hypothetical protein